MGGDNVNIIIKTKATVRTIVNS